MTTIIRGDTYPLLLDDDLALLEQRIGAKLPVDYKQFLLTYNGGMPEPDGFFIQNDPSNDSSIIQWFFGIKEGEYDSLTHYVEQMGRRIPKPFLPIGRDWGGNWICLVLTGADKGKIYFWSLEEESDFGKPPTYTNLYFVANSFADLLDSLIELDDD